MINPGDIFRYFCNVGSQYWIMLMGRSILHKRTGERLRGIFQMPALNAVQHFGIDDPDELEIEVSFPAPFCHQAIKIADKLHFGGCDWIVVQRYLKDNAYTGSNRMVLVCQRYQESVYTGPAKCCETVKAD